MVSISPIDLFNALKEKIGEPQAKLLTEYVTQNIDSKFETAKEHLATKKDIAEAKTDTLKWMIALFAPFYVGMIVFVLKQFL